MGAINYYTSDYITLGIKPYSVSDYTEDREFLDFISEEWGVDLENEQEVLNAAYEQINFNYEADKDNAVSILNKYDFYYFHVELKPGYYEGFSLDIENNYSVCLDSYEDRREAQKEITQLKKCLLELAGVGFVSCSPGWCTGYKDYQGTLTAIHEAIKEMRDDYNIIPTWSQYERQEA